MGYYRMTWVVPKDKEKKINITGHIIYKADSKEEAMERLKKDPFFTYDKEAENVTINELSVDEYIADKEKDIHLFIRKFYFYNHFDVVNLSPEEYFKKWSNICKDHEEHLNAVLEFSKEFSIYFRSEKELDLERITVKDYQQFLKQATTASLAEDEAEVNRLFALMPQKKGGKPIPSWY